MTMTLVVSILYLFSMMLAQAKNVNTFIIQVYKPKDNIPLDIYHQSFLSVTTNKDALLYSYKHAISGFSARLTDAEVQTMKKKENFISATPGRTYRLSTTRSPRFLGLQPGLGLWNQTNKGKGVIIAMIDSGILPSHPSFSATNMSCPPAEWKGKCEFSNKTDCNNKIIGAQSFLRGSNVSGNVTPLDVTGHGTHTSSTAAGGFVQGACVLGSACGTASGIAPKAHIAAYQVCTPKGTCENSDVLAAIDAAIEDGVDIISMSLGDDDQLPFYEDIVAIGLFAAVQQGIFVSCSASNSGPSKQTVVNYAPWVLTVGASTIDRHIRAVAKLGNELVFDGESIPQYKNFSKNLLPLVYVQSNGKHDSPHCTNGSLSGVDVKGKVVLCDGLLHLHPYYQSQEVKRAGGAATIVTNTEVEGFTILDRDFVIPATIVSYMPGEKIKAYINSTKSPTATIIFKGNVLGDRLAPTVAAFSSRGPSVLTPEILKPDIIAPGVNILGAVPYSLDDNTDSKLTFDIYSGTSQSCPHLSGVAALLKSAHPDWSPAAIKSAIMTTADLLNVGHKPILDQDHRLADVFATGAGHVNPNKAYNPGLIYDIGFDSYIPLLCGLGYSCHQVGKIVGKLVNCTSSIPQGMLNYPTFSVSLGPPQTFSRTVTNVGEPNSTYLVTVFAPQGVEIHVKPHKLRFKRANQKSTYSVTFSRLWNSINNTYSQGYLMWFSEIYNVSSVISVKFT